MEFSLQPNYSEIIKRYDAFWEREIIDRPPIAMILPKNNPLPGLTKHYDDEKSRWLDVEFRAAQIDCDLSNRLYLGDALPVAFPNLGPEIFSAWCGCGYGFGETTTWSEPCIHNWEEDADKVGLDWDHPYLKKLIEFTEILIGKGQGKFIVGLTDFHPGGDHLAALRDPSNLAMDMVENVDWVKKLLADSYPDYFASYDFFYKMLRDAQMPISSWLPLISEEKYYIPCNDFSCMISSEMFEEVFLPGIIEECSFFDRSIYHLDGPGALRHLDFILDIPELDAVQWVPGAGNEGFEKWVHVYQKIQAAGKGMQILNFKISDLDLLFESLRPEGIFISEVGGVDDEETAQGVLRRFEAWN